MWADEPSLAISSVESVDGQLVSPAMTQRRPCKLRDRCFPCPCLFSALFSFSSLCVVPSLSSLFPASPLVSVLSSEKRNRVRHKYHPCPSGSVNKSDNVSSQVCHSPKWRSSSLPNWHVASPLSPEAASGSAHMACRDHGTRRLGELPLLRRPFGSVWCHFGCSCVLDFEILMSRVQAH
jgi:hypothetical protein